ncbi:hypothetical protein D3C76_1649600 [compost metagenome]
MSPLAKLFLSIFSTAKSVTLSPPTIVAGIASVVLGNVTDTVAVEFPMAEDIT